MNVYLPITCQTYGSRIQISAVDVYSNNHSANSQYTKNEVFNVGSLFIEYKEIET